MTVGFGMFVPQGWKMELSGIAEPAAKWAKAKEIALAAEAAGYDSVWVYDHFHNVPKPAHEAVLECWTTMAALAEATITVRLGQMVGCAAYRAPSLLAKITSNVDVISGGRLEWGIGAGWYRNEFAGYGVPFAEPKDRIRMLAETVEIVHSMWTKPETTYQGRFFELDRAQCDPKPLQDPRPPTWIGGGGEQLTLRVVARLADWSNFGGKPEEWARKREILKEHCKAVGRDEEEIGKSWSPDLIVRESEAEVAEFSSMWGEPRESWVGGNLVGTPEQVCEKVARYVELGCSYFVPWCRDYPDMQSLSLFAEKVMPEFR
ncbi:MAG: TIGR03560 family F420-dependent LLM class oxidoreductase [Actinomycetota bacterium]|nr:TIGR03560 family F420-dependent LLM class oxidoreductase [Actinomycetota bacterium]